MDHADVRVQEAIKNLQQHYRCRPHTADEIDSTSTPLVMALKDALYAAGGHDHEAALREALDISCRMHRHVPAWYLFFRKVLASFLSGVAPLALLILGSAVALAQPLQLLDCVEVNLLAHACDGAMGEDAVAAEEVIPAPRPAEPPLFTLQTMRPDTPPLLVKVFNEPTDANLDAFLEWEHRYLARTFEVEAKLKQRRQQRQR